MSKIYFTADQHFYHDMIIQYCDRPFSKNVTMTRALIKKWNNKVTENDDIYVIGDFCFQRNINVLNDTLNRLNGNKILILGNHDTMKPFDYVEMGFESVHTYLHLPNLNLHLAHDPAVATVSSDSRWICGHIHNWWKALPNIINVGVDVWDFAPVSIDEIENLFDFTKDNKTIVGGKNDGFILHKKYIPLTSSGEIDNEDMVL